MAGAQMLPPFDSVGRQSVPVSAYEPTRPCCRDGTDFIGSYLMWWKFLDWLFENEKPKAKRKRRPPISNEWIDGPNVSDPPFKLPPERNQRGF